MRSSPLPWFASRDDAAEEALLDERPWRVDQVGANEWKVTNRSGYAAAEVALRRVGQALIGANRDVVRRYDRIDFCGSVAIPVVFPSGWRHDPPGLRIEWEAEHTESDRFIFTHWFAPGPCVAAEMARAGLQRPGHVAVVQRARRHEVIDAAGNPFRQ
jgi:hypothetical protein